MTIILQTFLLIVKSFFLHLKREKNFNSWEVTILSKNACLLSKRDRNFLNCLSHNSVAYLSRCSFGLNLVKSLCHQVTAGGYYSFNLEKQGVSVNVSNYNILKPNLYCYQDNGINIRFNLNNQGMIIWVSVSEW